ncbi:MAG: phosphatase PAP2 family protein [Candidatus Brocadiia bacterium]
MLSTEQLHTSDFRLHIVCNYRLIDYLTQGYLLLVGLLVLLFHGDYLPQWGWYVVGHAAVIGVVHGLIRLEGRVDNRLLTLVLDFYPMILYTFLYWETHALDSMFIHGPLDAFFIELDRRIFGCDPSRDFILRVPYFPISELMYFSYSTYYFMIPGVGLGLYFTRRRRFFQYITVISFVFFVCYLTYIFLPVLGPHAHERLAAAGQDALLPPRMVPNYLRRGLFYQLMQFIYRTFEPSSGAAFPSSHVAVAVAAATYTWRYLKSVRWPHAVVVTLLAVSTVYCGYHYAVDIFAGVLAGAILTPVGEWIYRKWEPGLSEARGAEGPELVEGQ